MTVGLAKQIFNILVVQHFIVRCQRNYVAMYDCIHLAKYLWPTEFIEDMAEFKAYYLKPFLSGIGKH